MKRKCKEDKRCQVLVSKNEYVVGLLGSYDLTASYVQARGSKQQIMLKNAAFLVTRRHHAHDGGPVDDPRESHYNRTFR